MTHRRKPVPSPTPTPTPVPAPTPVPTPVPIPAQPRLVSDTLISSDPTVRPWGEGKLAEFGDWTVVLYQVVVSGAYLTKAWLRNAVTKAEQTLTLAGIVANDLGEFAFDGTNLYVTDNQDAKLWTFPLTGGSSSVTFGTAQSRTSGLELLASGALVMAWYDFDISRTDGPLYLAYRSPNGTWTQSSVPNVHVLSSGAQIRQHPSGEIWVLVNADSFGRMGAYVFTEPLTLAWSDEFYISTRGPGGVFQDGVNGPDGELPQIASSVDATAIYLAYESDNRKQLTPIPPPNRVVSIPAIATIHADRSRSIVQGPDWVERIDGLGSARDLLCYRPVQTVSPFACDTIAVARYSGSWSVPLILGRVTFPVFPANPITADLWIGSGISRPEFVVRTTDGLHHYVIA